MAKSIRVAIKSLTVLNSFDERQYECFEKKNAVFFNGQPFHGSLNDFRDIVRHELKSCVKIRRNYGDSVSAIRAMANQMKKPWDYLVYFAHGGDGRRWKVRTILSFSDGIYDQHDALERVSQNMISSIGTKFIISCFQTWDGKGEKPLHSESIQHVPPRLVYVPSGSKAMLSYTTHKIQKGVR